MFEATQAPRQDASAGELPRLGIVSEAELLASLPKIRRRRVAILGFADTVKEAPFQDESWELWAMNGFQRLSYVAEVPESRYSLWFDLHTVEYTRQYGQATGTGDAQLGWLSKPHPFKVFMQDEAPEFPSVVAFPLDELVAKLGRDYFTSSIAYALAYALAQDDIAELGLWGIDLVHGTEWGDQRPCAEYWIGRLEASGIKLTIHDKSALLKQRGRYGYESRDPLTRELRTMLTAQGETLFKSIEQGKANAEAMINQARTDDGALQMIRGILERLDIYDRGGRV